MSQSFVLLHEVKHALLRQVYAPQSWTDAPEHEPLLHEPEVTTLWPEQYGELHDVPLL